MSNENKRPVRPVKLYQHPLSGHSHRVRLMMSLLGIPCELIEIDLRAGEQVSPKFLSMNRFGQVPVIDDDGYVLADSNAILVYLVKRYGAEDWLPEAAIPAAEVQRWLSVAAGPLCYGPALARVVEVFKRDLNAEELIEKSHALFKVMNEELAGCTYLVGTQPTIADVAMYTYTAHAPEGRVSLEPYPNIRAWLARIESLPGFVAMQSTPVGLCA